MVADEIHLTIQLTKRIIVRKKYLKIVVSAREIVEDLQVYRKSFGLILGDIFGQSLFNSSR